MATTAPKEMIPAAQSKPRSVKGASSPTCSVIVAVLALYIPIGLIAR